MFERVSTNPHKGNELANVLKPVIKLGLFASVGSVFVFGYAVLAVNILSAVRGS